MLSDLLFTCENATEKRCTWNPFTFDPRHVHPLTLNHIGDTAEPRSPPKLYSNQ